jgi:dTDP-4-dehydrorhamnose reductase
MILVTGVNGQLGYDVVRVLKERNIECLGIDKDDLDITDEKVVNTYITTLKPECVVHCAAYTAVDKAEEDYEVCAKVNVSGTEYIAKACKEIDAKMIYISTDYVYDGNGDEPFEVNGHIEPHSVYGKTKYEGELKVQEILNKYFIVRISWVFGINGNNFVKTMLRLGKEKDEINVVCDQIGSPTYTADLAQLLCDMAISEKYGVYNATNEGYCSWAEFAEEIMKQGEVNCKINHIPTSEYPAKAVRPFNSKMSKRMLSENGFEILPHWKDALKDYVKKLN